MKAWLRIFFSLIIFFTIAPSIILGLVNPQKAYALPTNIIKTQIATNFTEPVDFVIAPDGKIFVGEKGGKVKLVKNGQIQSNLFVTLPVNSQAERGLLGITLDPNYSSNHFVYVTYTANSPLEYRVSRLVDNNDIGVNETILFKTDIAQSGGTHMGGGIDFSNGKIYFTIGDNTLGEQGVSQDLNSYFGKLLRINPDGSIPADNPFVNQAGKKGEIWAYGFRNPFRFSFRSDGLPLVADVGGDFWEEVDLVEKGGNYGWPDCEGPSTGNCSNPDFKAPLYSYPHNGSGASITGGMVFTGDKLPQEYQGSYFFGDYVRGFIKRLSFNAAGSPTENAFDDTAGTAVSIKQSPDGAVYFLTIYPGILYKVYYSTDNQPPIAKILADPTFGNAPLTVNFSSSQSSDPEGQPLSFKWEFGDGATSTEQNPSHSYSANGQYNVKLIVNDGQIDSQPFIQVITVGNTPPTAQILSPQEGKTYNGGEIIFIEGNGTDAEDGELPVNAFSWEIIRYVDDFQEVFRTFNQKSATWVTRNDGKRSANQRYEIKMTARDSSGLETTVSRTIFPNKVTLSFNSDPVSNLVISLDGVPFATPYTTEAVVDYKIPVSAVSPVTRDGKEYQFESWSDGGSQSHQITVPAANTTYTAKYKTTQNSTAVGKFSVIAGDVKINGQALYDNDGATGLVVLVEQDAQYEAPWGASVIPNSDLQTAEAVFAQVKEEIKNKGCGSSCSSVIGLKWPSEAPPEKVVVLVSGEKKNFEKYSVVAGDVKINGSVLFDSEENSGLVALLGEAGEIEAPWGATVFRNGSLEEAQKLQASLAENLKKSGCTGTCATVQTPAWP